MFTPLCSHLYVHTCCTPQALPEERRTGMLWRLANQSVLSDLLTALHAAGFNDPAIGSAVRATTCHFQLDLQHDTLRVSVALGAPRIET